jgi:hypothetical protein
VVAPRLAGGELAAVDEDVGDRERDDDHRDGPEEARRGESAMTEPMTAAARAASGKPAD